jgi:hypothetical protein
MPQGVPKFGSVVTEYHTTFVSVADWDTCIVPRKREHGAFSLSQYDFYQNCGSSVAKKHNLWTHKLPCARLPG